MENLSQLGRSDRDYLWKVLEKSCSEIFHSIDDNRIFYAIYCQLFIDYNKERFKKDLQQFKIQKDAHYRIIETIDGLHHIIYDAQRRGIAIDSGKMLFEYMESKLEKMKLLIFEQSNVNHSLTPTIHQPTNSRTKINATIRFILNFISFKFMFF